MRFITRFPRLMLVIAVTALVLVPAVAAAAPRPAANCVNIDALAGGFAYSIPDEEGNLIGFDVVGTALGGTVTGTNLIVKGTPGGVIHFSGELDFDGPTHGSFTTTDEGVVTPNGRLNTKLEVIAGGTGFISSHGIIYPVDQDTFVWQVHERGRICIDPAN
jgi:hypothetical protein